MSKAIKEKGTKPGKSGTLPVPSPEPETNLLIADIVLRGATRTLRETLRKRLIMSRYDPEKARELMDGRTLIKSMGLYGASRLASSSSAGLAVVAGGLALKALYDRGKVRNRRIEDEDFGES